MRVTVLGAGAMGAAMAFPMADSGHHVTLWGTRFDTGILRVLEQGGAHPRLGVEVPEGVRLAYEGELEEAVASADLLVVAVSTAGLGYLVDLLRGVGVEGKPMLVVTKGLVERDGRVLRVSELLAGELGVGEDRVVYACGPTLAGELARRTYTVHVYSCLDLGLATRLSEAFKTQYYTPLPHSDLAGSEVSAALKNVYAIAVGVVEGLAERGLAGRNTRALAMTVAVQEMTWIAEACGGRAETAYWLPGLGDLEVTVQGGRNGMLGKLIGSGMSVEEALEEVGRRGLGVVEGYEVAPRALKLVEHLVDKGRLARRPRLLEATCKLLFGETTPLEVLETLRQAAYT